MTLDLDTVTPKAADWFTPRVRYEGRGRAEFKDPKGTVEGQAAACFDENGNSSIELIVDKVECERELHFGIQELLAGGKPVRNGKVVSFWVGTETNPCTSFSLKTAAGMFSARDGIRLQEYSLGETADLKFHSLRSQFDTAAADGQPKYWVLPLSNFGPEFHFSHPTLDSHPLRIYPTPSIPEGLNTKDAVLAAIRANEQNKLIIFEFNGSLGFIEPLADFEQRVEQLKSGRCERIVTAVMAAEIPNGSDLRNLEIWLPFDFLLLLGLAVGNKTGTPWIELRGESGALIQRIHEEAGLGTFMRGRPAISGGIGALLSQCRTSMHFGGDTLRVALKSAIQGGQSDRTLEERMAHISRGFDCLCKHFGFGTQQLTHLLEPSEKQLVKQALGSAAAAIREAAASCSDRVKSDRLRKIADRTIDAASQDRDFGLAVSDLLRSFDFPDARIIDSHFQTHPRKDGKLTWSSVVSSYRGDAIHKYLDVRADPTALEDALIVTDHCHDILVRVILKMLNYSGAYRPMMRPTPNEKPVDWVQATTLPSELGYR